MEEFASLHASRYVNGNVGRAESKAMTATPEEMKALRAENIALKAKLERSIHTIEIYKSMLVGRSAEKLRPASATC
jgi:hypothetical protein